MVTTEEDEDISLPNEMAKGAGLNFNKMNEKSTPSFDMSGAIGRLKLDLNNLPQPAPNNVKLAPLDPSRLPPPPDYTNKVPPSVSGIDPSNPLSGIGVPPGFDPSKPNVDVSKFTPPPGSTLQAPPGASGTAGNLADGAASSGARTLWPMSPELQKALFPNATDRAEGQFNSTQWWLERQARGPLDQDLPDDPPWMQELRKNGTLFGEGEDSGDRFDNFTSRDYALLVGAPVVMFEETFRQANNSAVEANRTAVEFIMDGNRTLVDFVVRTNQTIEEFRADVEQKRQELIWFAANCTAPTVQNCSNVVEIIDNQLDIYNAGKNTSALVDIANEAEKKRQELMRSGGLLACCNPNPTHFLRYQGQDGFTRIYDDNGRPTGWYDAMSNASVSKQKRYTVGGHDMISQKRTLWRRDIEEGGACAPMFQCVPCSITKDGETAELCPQELTDPNGLWGGCEGVCMPCLLGDFCPGGTVNTFAHTLASVCPDGHYCPPLGLNLTVPGAPPPPKPQNRRRSLNGARDSSEADNGDDLETSQRRTLAQFAPPPPPEKLEAPHAWLVPCPEGQICPAGMPLLMEQTSCQAQLVNGIRKAMKHRQVLSPIPENTSSGYYCPQGWSGYDSIKSPDAAFRPCPRGAYCPNAAVREKCPPGKFCRKRSAGGTTCPWSSDCSGEGNESPSPAWARTLCILIFMAIMYYWYNMMVKNIQKVQQRSDERYELLKGNKISAGSAEAILKNASGESGTPKNGSENSTGFPDCENRVTIEFVKLNLFVGNKQILTDITGSFSAGHMTALMGPSGCGKSSLMNVICGRAAYGKVTGNVKVNDVDTTPGSVGGAPLGYVPQEDTVYGDLTVRENLEYAARLRLPTAKSSAGLTSKKSKKDAANQEIDAMVNAVLDMIGLGHIQHSIVGTVTKRGISGGQKKRVNVGVEMVSNPTLLFLDEPTSGLGATDTLELMGSLANVAKTGRTIAAVIHQPRYQVFLMFHELVLLGRGGQPIFVGPTSLALNYFEGPLNFSCPENENPADFFMDCVGGMMLDDDGKLPTLDDLFAEWRTTESMGLEATLRQPKHKNHASKDVDKTLVELRGALQRQRSKQERERNSGEYEAHETNPAGPVLESFGSGASSLVIGFDEEFSDVADDHHHETAGPVVESAGRHPLPSPEAVENSNSQGDREQDAMVAMLWGGVMPQRAAGGIAVNKLSSKRWSTGDGEPAIPGNADGPLSHATSVPVTSPNRMSQLFFRNKPGKPRGLPNAREGVPWMTQFVWLFHRLVMQKVRSFGGILGRMLSLCFAGLAVGVFMSSDYQVYDPRDDKLAMVGVMMSAIASCFASVSSCNYFGADVAERKREEMSGISAPLAYLARIIIDIIEHCSASAFFLGMSYNFVLPEMPFATFWAILMTGSYAAGGIGVLASETVAQSNQALVSVMTSLVSCIFVNGIIGLTYTDVKTLGATWLWACSPGRWMVESILVGELRAHAALSYQELIVRTTLGDQGLGFYPPWSSERQFERWLWKKNFGLSTSWSQATPEQKLAYSKDKYEHWQKYLDDVVTTGCCSLFAIGTILRFFALLSRMYTPIVNVIWGKFTSFFPATAKKMKKMKKAVSLRFENFAKSNFVRGFIGRNSHAIFLTWIRRWIRFFAITPIRSYPTVFYQWVTGKNKEGEEVNWKWKGPSPNDPGVKGPSPDEPPIKVEV